MPWRVRDLRRLAYRRRIMSVDVQQPRACNLLSSDFRRIQPQAVGALPQHRALAGGLIDENICGLIGAALAHLHVDRD